MNSYLGSGGDGVDWIYGGGWRRFTIISLEGHEAGIERTV